MAILRQFQDRQNASTREPSEIKDVYFCGSLPAGVNS